MPPEIALTVAVDIELADAAGTGDRVLEDAGEDGLPLPRHVLRHADIDRQQPPDYRAAISAFGRYLPPPSLCVGVFVLALVQFVVLEGE